MSNNAVSDKITRKFRRNPVGIFDVVRPDKEFPDRKSDPLYNARGQKQADKGRNADFLNRLFLLRSGVKRRPFFWTFIRHLLPSVQSAVLDKNP